MPNSKKLPHAERKAKKRASRKALKAIECGLTHTQRTALRRARKEKHIGVKAFLAKAK
jgi:hypothetical protein